MASRASEPQAGTHQDARHQQVMSQRMGFHPEGSAAEPSYGSVAGGPLEAGRQAGRALLPMGSILSVKDRLQDPRTLLLFVAGRMPLLRNGATSELKMLF